MDECFGPWSSCRKLYWVGSYDLLPRRHTVGRAPWPKSRCDIPYLGGHMKSFLLAIWADDTASDLPEYAVAAAVLAAIMIVMKSLDIHGSDLLADMGIKTGSMAR